MDPFWERHWWLIILLAVFAVPIVQALFEPWRSYLRYRERRDAIEALKVYAAQGREPPPEVVDALTYRRWGRWRARMAQAGAAGAGLGATLGADHWVRRVDRWHARGRWNGAIFAGAITAGFAYASQHVHQNAEVYLVVAVIAGAMTVAAVLSAIMATFWRID
jgi:hypothetical protein